ncbi:MAG: YraN family protein [Caldilineales bacterium]|nr:YraN family protein [Caldilineales bacterium]
MSHARKDLGALGEELAAAALQQAGLRIMARNWRCPAGEIDLVAEEKGVLAVVEVKTRRGRAGGAPEQAVDPWKQQKLCELAEVLSEALGWDGPVRIDMVGVEFDDTGKLLRVSHWREAVDCW